jgi:hypothetical protein
MARSILSFPDSDIMLQHLPADMIEWYRFGSTSASFKYRGRMSTVASRTVGYHYPSVQLRYIDRCELVIKLVAIISIVTCPFWLWELLSASSSTSSIIGIPLLAIIAAAAILHFTQADSYLRCLMMTGVVARMAASGLFLWVGLEIYGGAVDAFHYWTVGLGKADQFDLYGWSVFQPPYWSSDLINNICGAAALLVGDAMPTLFITFSFVPLAGGYLYYRAFRTAFPDGDRWLFGLLVVLSPSLLFWSSFIGKDSLIQYFIALTCFGFAELTQVHIFRGAMLSAAGLAGTLLVRPHVAAMLAIAMTFPYVVGRSRAGNTRKVTKIILIPVLLGATYFLVTQARIFLYSKTSSNETASAFQEANIVTSKSQIGGSAFNQGKSFSVRIAESPFMMFRPFPWEIHNSLALASAAESFCLILFCLARRREIWSTLQHWRDPYVGFLLMYSIIFSIAFGASISNFGILARQRIMMMPLVFMVICAQPKLLRGGSIKSLKGNGRMGRTTFQPGLNIRS